MAVLTSVGLLLGCLCFPATGRADNFGAFEIEFVSVGNPGNPDDSGSTGFYHSQRGGVDHYFRIGKFEISRAMITALPDLGITLADMSALNSGDTPNSPATGISWNEAARFVNWLNLATGNPLAYKFAIQPGEAGYDSNSDIELWESGDDGYDPDNPYRNKNAFYFLPSENEWYKAAFYSGSGNLYYDFPTGSDDPPDDVDFEGDDVYESWFSVISSPLGPVEIDHVTVHMKPSPYGTYHQCGNVTEVTESDYSPPNSNPSENRATRNSFWAGSIQHYSSQWRATAATTAGFESRGFRVASIEPNPPRAADPNAALKKLLLQKIKKLQKAIKRAKSGNRFKAAKLKKSLKKLKQRLRRL